MSNKSDIHCNMYVCSLWRINTGKLLQGRATHMFTPDDLKNIDVVVAALRELVSSIQTHVGLRGPGDEASRSGTQQYDATALACISGSGHEIKLGGLCNNCQYVAW